MLTVRFPDGHAVTYNSANLVSTWNDCIHLMTKAGGDTVAVIQHAAGATIEYVRPCSITPPAIPTPEAAANLLVTFLEGGESVEWDAGYALADLKRALVAHAKGN